MGQVSALVAQAGLWYNSEETSRKETAMGKKRVMIVSSGADRLWFVRGVTELRSMQLLGDFA
jgi:hypothetical protein